MSEFVSNPLFGIALSILAYLVGMLIYRRFPHPLTTPLLLSAIFIIIFLKATGISYQDYYQGGVYLNNLIVPSTVALGIPLYKSFHLAENQLVEHFVAAARLDDGDFGIVGFFQTARWRIGAG